MTDLIHDWIAIARRLLPQLLLCIGILYLTHIIAGAIARSNLARRHLWSRGCRLFAIALVAAFAMGQLKTGIYPYLGSGLADVAVAQEHRANIKLGEANVAIGGGGYVTGIYLHPQEPNLAYMKTDMGGFYRWNESEQRWIPISDRFPMAQSNYYGGEGLALDPNDPNIVYIAAGKYHWAEPGAIFKSSDRGQSWTKLDLELPMGSNQHKKWLGERLVVNPFDSNVLFFGSRRDGLWQSSDAGATWTKFTAFPGKPDEEVGIPGIVFDKQTPGLVYVNAYEDGIYQSPDLGVTWSKVAGSPEAVNRMAVASDGTLYVTSTSRPGISQYANGSWRTTTPGAPDEIFGGISVNPANPKEAIATLDRTAQTKFYHSLDGGYTWTQKKVSVNNTVPWWPDSQMAAGNFFANHLAAIEFDPNVAGRVWFTDWFGVWRTEDINAHQAVWTNYVKGHEQVVTFDLVSPPSGPLLISGLADVEGFYHDRGLDAFPSRRLGFGIGEAPFQDTFSIAYCQTAPSHLVRVGGNRWNSTHTGATSSDGGRTWQKFASFPSERMTMRVAMSATDPNLFLVTLSEGQPLRTTDGGRTWKSVSGLPDGPKGPWNWSRSLAADSADGNTFYYYYNDKVYRSTDGGASFQVTYEPLVGENKWHSLKTMPGVKGEVWISLDRQGLYRSSNGGESFSQIPNVERAHLFAFGKPPANSITPALYLYGKIQNRGEGIFRSLDRGKTWTPISDPNRLIGNEPNVMEASKQVFGLVFVGTNGRGIYYGTQ